MKKHKKYYLDPRYWLRAFLNVEGPISRAGKERYWESHFGALHDRVCKLEDKLNK